ncbi:hypothetical protein [Nostoc sp.]
MLIHPTAMKTSQVFTDALLRSLVFIKSRGKIEVVSTNDQEQ